MAIKEAESLAFLNGGGEMGALMRSKDWSHTSLGTPDKWPNSLRTIVSILLNSQFPMFVWWGEELVTLYNDSYRVIAGEKHPGLLGKSGRESWAEIWDNLEPLVNQVFDGKSTWSEDQLLEVNRRGFVEETYFTFSYSPIIDDWGKVNGLFCACIETTEKVLAARKIQESERNLRNTILQSPVAMCILKGPAFIVEIANKRMYELWGRGPEELMHKPIFDGIPEARNQGLEELLQHVFTTGETFSANERPVTLPRNGNVDTLFVNFVYEPFREGDGTISGIIAVAIDVTDQVIARKKVELSEQELQNRVEERTADIEEQKEIIQGILDSSINAILALDAVRDTSGKIIDFKIIEINKQFKQIIGLDESVIGKSYLQYFANSLHNGIFDMYSEVVETGAPQRKEVFSTNLNLNAWFDISAGPRGENGVVVNFANISPQREAAIRIEEQKNLLDNILKNSPVGIVVYAAIRDEQGSVKDFKTILVNEAAVEFTGISAEERYQKTILELTPGLYETELFKKAIEAIEEGKPFQTEYYNEQFDKWLELSVVKMNNNRLLNVFRDITPIKHAHHQLEKNIENLKRSNANLEEFAYAASHDLKEPIRKIHFFSDRLRAELNEKLSESQSRLFERLENAAQRMGVLIDDLLAYSQATKGVSDLEEIDLNQKIRTVLEDLELEVQQKNAQIHIGELPTVKGQRRQIQQLFQNLLSNALKYSKPGKAPEIFITASKVKGRDVELNLSADESNRFYHLLQVKDNGVGFDQKDAGRIFNVFTRLHGNSEYRGTGVGLSIARKVVENHHGHIWADSIEGKGSIFNILLPAE